jgi:hypothetical protein
VTVEAAYSKHRRQDTLALRPALAAALRTHLATKTPGAPAFRMPKGHKEASALFRADLEAAGIPRRDAAGLVADFHSLRHTFITNLATAGVHPKTAQTLARHCTISLTMDRYTHPAGTGSRGPGRPARPDACQPGDGPRDRHGQCEWPTCQGGCLGVLLGAFGWAEGDSGRRQ